MALGLRPGPWASWPGPAAVDGNNVNGYETMESMCIVVHCFKQTVVKWVFSYQVPGNYINVSTMECL